MNHNIAKCDLKQQQKKIISKVWKFFYIFEKKFPELKKAELTLYNKVHLLIY